MDQGGAKRIEYSLFQVRVLLIELRIVVVTPEQLGAPKYEVALASTISPNRWKKRESMAIAVHPPSWPRPPIEVYREGIATAIGALHH